MKKKIWMAFGALCAVFLLLGVVQSIRQPEVLKEGLSIIAGYDLEFKEESSLNEGLDVNEFSNGESSAAGYEW